MQSSLRPVWFCLVVAGPGVLLLPWAPAFGVQWCCLWFGLAALYVGAARRAPRFVPLAPAADLTGMGFRRHEIEGPVIAPWYLLLLIGTTWACTMLVPLMSTAPAVLPTYGVSIGLVLAAGAGWLASQQRASARVMAALTCPPASGTTHLRATVAGPQPALRRYLHWFQIGGVRHGTERVQTTDGRTVDAATATPTSTTYGFCQEKRRVLRLESEQGPVTVETKEICWAAPRLVLSEAPPLQDVKPNSARALMVGTYVGFARVWEQETIGTGDEVIVAGTWDPDTRRVRGSSDRPVMVFGVESGRDPLAVLRAERWGRRWPILAPLVLGIIALVVGIVA